MASASGLHFFVTGSPGIGKTTLIIKVLEKLKLAHPDLKVQGFYTREVRNQGQRVGFEVVTLDGRRDMLASIDSPGRAPMVGKYKVNVPGFEALILPELEINSDTQLFIIDEVGKMELFSRRFFPAVEAILGCNIPVLGSVPIKHSSKEVEKIINLSSSRLITLDRRNRDKYAEELINVFNGLI